MASHLCTLGFATAFGIVALALIAIGFGTNSWQKIRVKAADVAAESSGKTGYEALAFLDRDTGLFRTCFKDTPIVLDAISNKASPSCIKNHYEIPEKNPNVADDSNYMVYAHLMRTAIALLILCMLLLLIGLIIGCLGCWRVKVALVRGAGVCVLLSTLCGVGGMAVWMGAEYVEQEKVTSTGLNEVIPFPKTYSTTLSSAVTKTYGWSFILAWIGVALTLIAGILYLISLRYLDEPQRKRRYSEDPYYRHQTDDTPPVVYALDSTTYTRAPKPAPQPMPPAYTQQAVPQMVYQQQVVPQQVATAVAPGQYYDTTLVRQDNSWGWNKF